MAKCANENCTNEVARKHAVFCSRSYVKKGEKHLAEQNKKISERIY